MGLPLHRFEVLASTQTYLKEHPELGFCGVLAEAQTEGRGRWGRDWESQAGSGLCLSAAVPDSGLPPGLLLQRAMLQAARILDPGGKTLGLKWPNDLIARRDGRLVKVGGIIGEVQGDRVILGLGVNLTQAPRIHQAALPPACIAELGLFAPDPAALAATLLEAWQDLSWAPEPAFRWPSQGEAIRWEEGQGIVLGWEEDGRLRIANAAGIQRLSGGEVHGLLPKI